MQATLQTLYARQAAWGHDSTIGETDLPIQHTKLYPSHSSTQPSDVLHPTSQAATPIPSVLQETLPRPSTTKKQPPTTPLYNTQPLFRVPPPLMYPPTTSPHWQCSPEVGIWSEGSSSSSPPSISGAVGVAPNWVDPRASHTTTTTPRNDTTTLSPSSGYSIFSYPTPEDTVVPGLVHTFGDGSMDYGYQPHQGGYGGTDSSSSEGGSMAGKAGGGGGGEGGKGKGKKTSPGGDKGPGKGKEGKVKKKAAKACSHCQKAHLTCNDERPCQRCVKKGMADTCVDGQRKKAKYLMDDVGAPIISTPLSRTSPPHPHPHPHVHHPYAHPHLPTHRPLPAHMVPGLPAAMPLYAPPRRSPTPVPLSKPDPLLFTQDGPSGPSTGLGGVGDDYYGMDFLHDSDPIFNLNFDPTYPFDSQAANQEYTMLSSIFADGNGNIGTPSSSTSHHNNSALSQPIFQLDQTAWPDASAAEMGGPPAGDAGGWYPENGVGLITQPGASGSGSAVVGEGQDGMPPHNPFGERSASGRNGVQGVAVGGRGSDGRMGAMSASAVYSQVTKPYDYTEGYHFLMRYLTQNFSQEDTLKVVKSLAAFRPSMIALLMPLSVEDEVFLEKSFQRTLIELDKLISYSGTPTAIWRRTGELCLVGDEFCALSEFSRADLLGKKTFVYQLFDKATVVDYYEKFSQHAFENTTQNFFLQCVIVSATGKKVPCSCCFTIRRDVFDLPSVIIGQLLPIV